MKYSSIAVLLLATLCFGACGSSGTQQTPNSTPVDSTNINGTAPLEYNNPDNKNKEMLPDEPTSGNRANTPGGDSIPSAGRP